VDSNLLKQDPIYIIINSKYKILYMSATPRFYEMEDKNDVEAENVLRNIIHWMSFSEAIKNKYIADYKIYLPILEDESQTQLSELLIDIENELQEKLNIEVSKKCSF